MASIRVRDQLSKKPAASVKPVVRSNSTVTRSALAGVTNISVAARGKKEGNVDRGAKQAKGKGGVVTRERCTAARSFLPSGVENRDSVTVQVKREVIEEEQEEQAVAKVVSKTTKTRATATRVPKSTTVTQHRPSGANTAECSVATMQQRPSFLARVSTRNIATGALQTKTRRAKQTLPAIKEDKGRAIELVEDSYKTNDGRFVSIRIKKTTSTSTTDPDHHRTTRGVASKAKKATKRAVEDCQPLSDNGATGAGQNILEKCSSKPVNCDGYAQLAPLKLVPYEPEADIDLTDDPSMCGEYSGDIYVHHRKLEEETHYLVCATFLEHQKDITSQHRRVLVDWLAQVHYKYRLLQETMILTVDILDRYLQIAIVSKAKLQLVGLASLLISSKFEEIYAPSVYELEHIAANTYTRPEIICMEKTILRELDYRLIKPYPLHFLRRFSRLSHTDTNVHHLAKYFIDLSLLECEGSVLLPSKKAAAAFILASVNLYGSSPQSVWSRRLQVHTGYSLPQLAGTVKSLLSLVKTKHFTDKAAAIRERYTTNAPTEQIKTLLKGKELGPDRISI